MFKYSIFTIIVLFGQTLDLESQDLKYFDASLLDFDSYDPMTIYTKYHKILEPEYKLDLDPQNYYEIEIYINPCGSWMDDSCYLTNDFKNNYMILAGPDMQIVECDKKWAFKEICGSYLEIHRPLNKDIILEKALPYQQPGEFFQEFLLSKNLCAGKYDLWYVVRGRAGSIIQKIQPFYVEEPSCE